MSDAPHSTSHMRMSSHIPDVNIVFEDTLYDDVCCPVRVCIPVQHTKEESVVLVVCHNRTCSRE